MGSGRPMPVEHDDVFPLVPCCSISRLPAHHRKASSSFISPSGSLYGYPKSSWGLAQGLLASRPLLWQCGASSSECDINARSPRETVDARSTGQRTLPRLSAQLIMSGVRRRGVDASSRLSREQTRAQGQKSSRTAQIEPELGAIDVEDEMAACASHLQEPWDYEMARAIRYDWPSIWALAALKFFDHANQRILDSLVLTNKQTRLFFLTLLSTKFICFGT